MKCIPSADLDELMIVGLAGVVGAGDELDSGISVRTGPWVGLKLSDGAGAGVESGGGEGNGGAQNTWDSKKCWKLLMCISAYMHISCTFANIVYSRVQGLVRIRGLIPVVIMAMQMKQHRQLWNKHFVTIYHNPHYYSRLWSISISISGAFDSVKICARLAKIML